MSHELNRRDALRLGVAGGAAFVATQLPSAAVAAPPRFRPHGSPKGTTLDATVRLGSPGRNGYRLLVAGPGEPRVVRDDLLAHRPQRKARPRPLLAFGQLTDTHLVDAQSPGRVEFLDRYSDPDQLGAAAPLDGQYRPHDMLTVQVAESMVQALNRVRRGPATGVPMAFTICTGDNVDNTQYNELRWQIDVLDGQRVRPDSGDPRRYEGVADPTHYDTRYWHPEGAPGREHPDLPRTRNGFPAVPGLLDSCRRPFHATGLDMPWLTTFGNHDGLMSGSVPPTAGGLRAMTTGGRKVIDLPPGTDVLQLLDGINTLDPGALATLFAGPARSVTPDLQRRPLSRAETIAEHFRTASYPRGHGYTDWNRRTGNAYYAVDHGPVRCLILDTVNPNGGPNGSIDEQQARWLAAQLAAGSSRHLDQHGRTVQNRCHDKLFAIFSHHTLDTMDNLAAPEGVTRYGGAAVRDLLLRHPNVIAWVNGHTHENTVTPRRRPSNSTVAGGFWEISTAAHIDWPVQSRVIEVADNRNGTLSVFGTIVDLASPLRYRHGATDPINLASLARELSANDWQPPSGGLDIRRGSVEDRNVELLLPAPFGLGLTEQ
ncbi:TIGR03767 family metallophosphoesterase [Luteipulveratus mongoliensis]|uniref:Metallophosphoesterase n=1 Tax=Luteipulveratus mongoliensis TaxID=571913 RepID=A0A0K1JDF0_9MICO|nr:TIGR03767 family metallophosphoesterase [Luteipulveratus mongoliensis]AKU14727.1 hypothetical protein VV02_00630 [Luteipulveratus mongoliensis]